MSNAEANQTQSHGELIPTLGWFSATTIVAGSMVGSGIFIVSADIARNVGTSGMLMAVWIFAGVLTLLGASSYGKLASYMPKAGGQYVFLKESWGELVAFLYGWVLLAVIQTGFLAAVAVAFAKFLGVLLPADRIAEIVSSLGVIVPADKDAWSYPLLWLSPKSGFVSLQSICALLTLLGLTLYNSTGIKNGAILQNIFTSLKVLALLLLTAIGFIHGRHLWDGSHDWSLHFPSVIEWSRLFETGKKPPVADLMKGPGLLEGISLFAFASVGALFSADAWNYVTFIGGEVKDPKRNLNIALIAGTAVVVGLYLVANLAYLNLLPLDLIAKAPQDRVATLAMEQVFPGDGVTLMASIILISTFGCLNGMLLSGARVFYAMAKDGLLFKQFGEVHPTTHSPNFSLWVQFVWASLLALSGTYGKLLDYIVFSSLVFYIVTMLGLLKLAKRIPEEVNMTKPSDFWVPKAYIAGASFIAFFLLFGELIIGLTTGSWTAFDSFFDTKFFTSIAGLLLTAIGVPIYKMWKSAQAAKAA